MADCMKSDCGAKSGSHLGFFVAMLLLVAIGGGVYLYLDATVFSPVEQQVQTAQQNPGLPHPPKDKMNHGAKVDTGKPSADAITPGK